MVDFTTPGASPPGTPPDNTPRIILQRRAENQKLETEKRKTETEIARRKTEEAREELIRINIEGRKNKELHETKVKTLEEEKVVTEGLSSTVKKILGATALISLTNGLERKNQNFEALTLKTGALAAGASAWAFSKTKNALLPKRSSSSQSEDVETSSESVSGGGSGFSCCDTIKDIYSLLVEWKSEFAEKANLLAEKMSTGSIEQTEKLDQISNRLSEMANTSDETLEAARAKEQRARETAFESRPEGQVEPGKDEGGFSAIFKLFNGWMSKLKMLGKFLIGTLIPLGALIYGLFQLDWKKEMDKLSKIFDKFKSGDWLMGTVDVINWFTEKFIKATLMVTADLLKAFGFEETGKNLEKIAKDFDLAKILKNISDYLSEFFFWTFDMVGVIFNPFIDAIKPFLEGNIFEGILKTLYAFPKAAVGAIGTTLEGLLKLFGFKGAADKVREFIDGFNENLEKFIQAFVEFIDDPIGFVNKAISNYFAKKGKERKEEQTEWAKTQATEADKKAIEKGTTIAQAKADSDFRKRVGVITKGEKEKQEYQKYEKMSSTQLHREMEQAKMKAANDRLTDQERNQARRKQDTINMVLNNQKQISNTTAVAMRPDANKQTPTMNPAPAMPGALSR